MSTRPLGSSELEVTVVGLGCNNFGGRIGEEASRAVIDAALDADVTFFDTADVYGNRGGSEEVIGRAGLRPQGDRGLAAAPPDRLDRPLPVPPSGRGHARRGDARRARRARSGGKGPCDRLLELHAAAG